MSEHVSFQLTQSDIDAWVQGLVPCPIESAAKCHFGNGAYVSGGLVIDVDNQFLTEYFILGRSLKYRRLVEEVDKGWFTREEIAEHHMRPCLVILEYRDGEKTRSVEPPKPFRPKPKRNPKRVYIPLQTGKPLDDDMAFDLMRERGML